MKQQVVRLSPHQNAKVFAVLSAVVSAVFLVPLAALMALVDPDASRPALGTLVAMPLVYLVFGYVFIVVACAIYNALVRVVGGFEVETGGDA